MTNDSHVDLLDVMRLPRHLRRAMAKINGVKKIPGSQKPYVKKENKEASR